MDLFLLPETRRPAGKNVVNIADNHRFIKTQLRVEFFKLVDFCRIDLAVGQRYADQYVADSNFLASAKEIQPLFQSQHVGRRVQPPKHVCI